MRLRDKIISIVCLFITVGLLIFSGSQLDYINSERSRMNLVINEPLENAPPSLAFATVAMGAFRGLVVDILWLRAEKLKQEGQFFDAKQLAEWITVLQPRFAPVWEFHAWNMAYNISVAIPATEPAERWRWVKNGYELLRDKGIELNPKSITLYRELARIFQHKIAGISDEVHKYYKLQLAHSMEPLLGAADNATFAALADAPKDWTQLNADPNFKELLNDLRKADDAFENESEFVSSYLSLKQNPSVFTPDAAYVLEKYAGSKVLKDFDSFARAYQLRNVWKLDPVLMNELNAEYGPADFSDPNVLLPLDWRHPDVHAIYWAIRGLRVASKEDYSAEEANTDRIVSHSLQNLFRNGKIFIYNIKYEDPNEGQNISQKPLWMEKEIFLRSDLRMFTSYNRAAQKNIEKYEHLREATYNSLRIGYRNMLKNAAFSFYQSGHERQARSIQQQLIKLYPEESEDWDVPLRVFIQNRLQEELESISLDNAKELVQMLLQESYFYYAMGEDNEAFSREKMANEIRDYYQNSRRPENRIDLPQISLMKYFALRDFLSDEQYSPFLRESLFNRLRIEKPQLIDELEDVQKKFIEQNQSLEEN